jgi:hypothetical protein
MIKFKLPLNIISGILVEILYAFAIMAVAFVISLLFKL